MLEAMIRQSAALDKLARLELPGCQVTDEAVLRCEVFQQLQHLDLSGTPVTKAVLAILDRLPNLESCNLVGSGVGWWSRRKATALLRNRQEAKPTLLNQ